MNPAIGKALRLSAFTLTATLLANGCVRINNTFSVSDPHHSASSAELLLCGRTTPLSKTAHGFYGSVPIACEGDGKVVVQLVDGRQASCIVGYVTEGMMQSFDYVIEGAECRAVAIHV